MGLAGAARVTTGTTGAPIFNESSNPTCTAHRPVWGVRIRRRLWHGFATSGSWAAAAYQPSQPLSARRTVCAVGAVAGACRPERVTQYRPAYKSSPGILLVACACLDVLGWNGVRDRRGGSSGAVMAGTESVCRWMLGTHKAP